MADKDQQIKKLEEELAALEKEKCPYCGQHHPGAEEKQKETRAEAQRLESQQECQATKYREKSLATDQIQGTAT